MNREHDNIEKFSIRLLVQNAIIGTLLANASNRQAITETFTIMKKDLLSSLPALGASEEILRYAERQTKDYEDLLSWDGKGQRPPIH